VQERFAQLDAYEPAHPVANQDFVEMDSVGTVDGQPLPGSEMKGRIIEVGKGVLRPEIEEAILGHRVGDRVEATLALGEDAPAAYRGKTAQFAVTIHGVKRKQLPTIDEELAKDAGVDSLASLRQRLREELERQRRAEGEAEQKQAVLKQLLAAHEFAVPEALVDRELGRLFYRLHPEAHQHEHRHEPDHGPSQQELEQFRATYEPAAVERVKGALLLDAVAADAGLAVTEEEIHAEIGLLATQMKTTPEQLRQVLKRQEGAVAQIRRRLLDDKTMSLLVSRATVQNA
jgi:trigger factor